ncbi:hypothetical protein SBF1_8090003 [Candidatus Desulfosporosinus infrequens]|uniref:Uncharacterized protein n=1 Tax=Candidatus Desulfosporosinus infrequens TaxID=2043169 RepID=A0A2U3LTI2_9FIRM|nr:hypothetical protein SBF1_8090003 [Candidatus Desulfosporosinus infrequens]
MNNCVETNNRCLTFVNRIDGSYRANLSASDDWSGTDDFSSPGKWFLGLCR